MKSVLRYTAASVALATLGFASNASAADGSATVSAQILDNLQLTATSSLNFGSITAPLNLAADATVVLSAAPTTVRTCDAVLTCSGTPTSANFTVNGLPNQTVAVSFPAATVTLDRSGGALGTMQDQMTVDTLTRSSNTVSLGAAGAGTFAVGGTLNVRPNQAPGVYTGAVLVRVEYN